MASPPISKAPPALAIRFLDANGVPIDAPPEWTPAWIELDVPLEPWTAPSVSVNGESRPVLRRPLAGRERALVEWGRAGAGYYRIALRHPQAKAERLVRVAPWKLSASAFEAMLDELEQELPITIALALQRGGALADVEPRALRPPSLAEEVERLRQAVEGGPARPGLADLLPALARRPHRVLHETALWVPRRRVRRIGYAGLREAMRRPANLEPGWPYPRPRRAPDRRVEPTLDVYENRIVRAFAGEVAARLSRLGESLRERTRSSGLAVEIARLSDRLRTARRIASFLDHVSSLAHAPRQLTMVLLRRPEYRAAFEGWLALHRSMSLRLREPALDAPLGNTPYLYELWATLLVVRALVETSVAHGWRVERQELVQRRGAGLWLEPLRGRRPAVVLVREGGMRIALEAQPTYGSSGRLRSATFPQRPDISIRAESPGKPPSLILFDPKYKLDSEGPIPEEGTEEEARSLGQPHKIDLDKMHAYRDAIRALSGDHVVSRASVLYPGSETYSGGGVGAIPAVPGRSEAALAAIEQLLTAHGTDAASELRSLHTASRISS